MVLKVGIRDEHGEFQVVTMKHVRAWWPTKIVEWKVACYGMTLARRFGFKKFNVKSNCLSLVQRVENCGPFL